MSNFPGAGLVCLGVLCKLHMRSQSCMRVVSGVRGPLTSLRFAGRRMPLAQRGRPAVRTLRQTTARFVTHVHVYTATVYVVFAPRFTAAHLSETYKQADREYGEHIRSPASYKLFPELIFNNCSFHLSL